MIKAGSLNQRITFQQKSLTRNGIGEEVFTWSDVATVWAEVIPIRGREFYESAQMQQAVDMRFRIRARSGLDGSMRLLWKTEPYDIIAIIPGTAQHAGTIEIMAVSGIRNGRV